MRKTKSLLAKTFVFTGILVLSVLLVVLSILYLLLPNYYLTQKQKSFEANIGKLSAGIGPDTSTEVLTDKLYQFAVMNNADLIAYDEKGYYDPYFSTPYILLRDMEVTIHEEIMPQDTVSLYISDSQGEDLTNNPSGVWEEGKTAIIEGSSLSNPNQNTTVSVQVGERAQTVSYAANTSEPAYETLYASNLLKAYMGFDHPELGTLMAYGTLQPIDEASQVIVSLFPVLLLISLVLGLPLAYIFARQLTKPIVSLSKSAVAMQEMNPETRGIVHSNNEVGTLAENLNHLYENLISTISLLEEERNQVEKLEQSKTQLMQSASHELKTPLAALNGIVEGMIDGVGVYKDRDTYLRIGKEQIDKLDTLVQEILSASQGDSQEILLEDVNLKAVLEQIIVDQKTLIDEKNLSIKLTVDIESLHTDLGLLKRSLSNLITNAVAYSPPNESLIIKGKDGVLEFMNKAPFIKQEELLRLTQPFYTRSISRDRTDHGTGLGLYIANQNLTRLGYTLILHHDDPYFIAEISF